MSKCPSVVLTLEAGMDALVSSSLSPFSDLSPEGRGSIPWRKHHYTGIVYALILWEKQCLTCRIVELKPWSLHLCQHSPIFYQKVEAPVLKETTALMLCALQPFCAANKSPVCIGHHTGPYPFLPLFSSSSCQNECLCKCNLKKCLQNGGRNGCLGLFLSVTILRSFTRR